METKNSPSADILDILFEGKNKAYGAYELRKTYNRRMQYALSGMVACCLLLTAGSIMGNAKHKNNQHLLAGPVVELTNIEPEKPEPEIPKPEVKPEQPKVAMEVLTPPKIVTDEQVKDEEVMKPVDDYETVKIGTVHQDGEKDEGIVNPPVEKINTGISAPVDEKPDYEKVFTSVQIPAAFPGGASAWNRFLEKNLNSNMPIENGAPEGNYKVIISFIVDKNGRVSDVKAEYDPGYGTVEEAIRVIRKGPDWSPAIQNGTTVNYRHKQAITFQVGRE